MAVQPTKLSHVEQPRKIQYSNALCKRDNRNSAPPRLPDPRLTGHSQLTAQRPYTQYILLSPDPDPKSPTLNSFSTANDISPESLIIANPSEQDKKYLCKITSPVAEKTKLTREWWPPYCTVLKLVKSSNRCPASLPGNAETQSVSVTYHIQFMESCLSPRRV